MGPPTLPARKAGGKRTGEAKPRDTLPPLPTELVLEDGTKIPVKIPDSMPYAQGAALIEYLKQNPDAAKQAHQQAQQMMRTPGMGKAFSQVGLHQQAGPPDAEMVAKWQVLKEDPELKHVFEDVLQSGPGAFAKYYNDTELMAKVSAKIGGVPLKPQPAPQATKGAEELAAASLHAAAKLGNVAAILRQLDEGKDVDELNERGITPLGVAVGFNRQAAVKVLLERGAEIDRRDPAGNTALHYAAGYGRKEVALQLLQAGADILATNKAEQRPLDAAKTNQELSMVELLEALMAKRVETGQ